MASKQRARAPKSKSSVNPFPDLGIFDVGNIGDIETMDEDDSDVDETSLEAELEAILSGKAPTKPRRPQKKVAMSMDIEKMAADCLRDSEEEDDNDDDLLSDPDLLKELQSLTCNSAIEEDDNPSTTVKNIHPDAAVDGKTSGNIVSLLEERLHLYNEAIEAAKHVGDNSKVRRYTRAIKTLEGLIKSAKSGKNINEEDIPPVVVIPKDNRNKTESSQKNIEEQVNKTAYDESAPQEEMSKDLKHVMQRRQEYKMAALEAKKAGDKNTALSCMKSVKILDSIMEALKNGEPVDLSNIPPPVDQETISPIAKSEPPQKELQATQTSSNEAAALLAASEPEDPAMFAAPPAPTSILEALEQRLDKYSSTKAAAVAEGNNSKVRRLQRIIKSYESAIKDYKAGKTIDFEELPTPPGFGPFPIPSQKNLSDTSKSNMEESKPPHEPVIQPAAPKRAVPEVPAKNTRPVKPKVQRTNTSTFDKQLEFLLERQKLFRQAALAAKQNGDIQQAKEYLRMSKGFDSMIEATKCGLPIDGSNIPTPPQLQSDFEIVDISECMPIEEGSTEELLETLEKDLTQQIEVCIRNKEHFLRLGDVSSASKFEKLGLESRKDLSVIRHLRKTGGPAPKFHYETRLFSIVQCHTELSDNELEVTVERGINLPGKPDDLDSYIKLDFPIPSTDNPQRAKTHTIRDTNNPIFQEEFKFEINRKSRAQLRQFKRQSLKLEVWSKGGFLRSDTLLGVVYIKLVDLETKCTIHDCFDLMEGRRSCGGKIQVKVRVRDPLIAKQVEEVREKWLVIGS